MKPKAKSIRSKILAPIFIFAGIITTILLLFVFRGFHNVSVKSFEFMVSRHSEEVNKILDTAVSELVSARLLDNVEVLEAKQKIALDQVTEYWQRVNYEGLIMRADGTKLYSSLDSRTEENIRSFTSSPGPFHFEDGLQHISGYTMDFPLWGWRISTIHKPINFFFELQREEIFFLFPIILFGMGLLVASIFIILKRNFQSPVAHIISDIKTGGNISDTGITELDTIVKAINDSFFRLNSANAYVRRFKQVIDSAFDVIFVADEKGDITYINPACERVTGYAPEELIGQKASLLFGLQEGISPDRLSDGTVWKGELFNRKKDGEAFYTSAVIFPIYGEELTSYASIQRDITQEKRLYEHLLRAQKLEAVGTLAGGFAHDFNNILTAILGYAELIRTMAKEGDPVFKPANIILHAAEQGAELTKKILSITRKEQTEVKPVNMNDVIHTSMDLLQRTIPKTIEIVTRLSEDIPPVLADASQLQQVVVNMAINSRDAMPQGGKLILGTEFQSQETADSGGRGFVKLFISDTGMGMDGAMQTRIFDPFFTTKETGKGTGLGLYIVHSILSNCGGHITVYSEPGMGTTFNMYFPVTEETGAGVVEAWEDLRGNGTVLVIDDEADVRQLCGDLLESLGYSVLIANGGEEGIEMFREMKDRIAAVVLDMIMPRMSGSEVYPALKTIQPDVRVILCSGYSEEGISGIEALRGEGVKKFIQKPFTRSTLGRALKEALRD